MLPSSGERQRTNKDCLCLTVGGDGMTSSYNQEKAHGQAGKTHNQNAGQPERPEGHEGLSDCPVTMSRRYLRRTFLGQL